MTPGGNSSGLPRALRIVFVSRALPVHRMGGLEYHLRDLAVALMARGHSVHIVTTARGSDEADIPGASITEIPGTRAGNYSLTFFRRAEAAALSVSETHDAHIVCPIDMAGLFMDPGKFKIPVVPIIHGTMTSEVPLDWRYRVHLSALDQVRETWRYKLRIGLLPAFRTMVRRMGHIFVDSDFTRRELLFDQRGPGTAWGFGQTATGIAKKITVIPLGIDFSRYPAPLPISKPRAESGRPLRICLLGRLQEQKGIKLAIKAAAALRARGVDFRMSLGGSGDYADAAQRYITELNLDCNVRREGRIAPEDLGQFFSRHDVFLFPDLTQPAFGLVALEAMHYGLPVLAARVGAVPEVVPESCGWLYNPWDADELAAKLADLYNNPIQLQKKRGCLAEHLARYTAEEMAIRTEAALLRLL